MDMLLRHHNIVFETLYIITCVYYVLVSHWSWLRAVAGAILHQAKYVYVDYYYSECMALLENVRIILIIFEENAKYKYHKTNK